MRALVLLSGGMDSTTLAYLLADEGYELDGVSFDYGQRHRSRELLMAQFTADKLDIEHAVVDLRSLSYLLSGSALTDQENVEVPEGHYSAETMKATVVPNRNAIMLSIATGIAVARGIETVACAVHAGDHPIYPDCRPEFIAALSEALRLGTDGFAPENFYIYAPFVEATKAEIAAKGDQLGVPWGDTWSCYVGGALHCGRCGTCVERAEAFDIAGVEDPTEYEDAEFWKGAVAAAS